MAEIKITMMVDDDMSESVYDVLSDEVEVFTCKLGILCKEFDNDNPAIITTMED